MTNWNRMDKHCIEDILTIVQWSKDNGVCDHNMEVLPKAVKVQSPVFCTRAAAALMDLGNNHEVSDHIKRLITQVLVYFDPLNTKPYGYNPRDEQGSRNAGGRIDVSFPVSLHERDADLWGEMTPAERGDWIARHRKVK